MASVEAAGSTASAESLVVKPPSHPTYDIKAVIALALAEDAGDLGDVTSLATIPSEMEVEAQFIAKEDGVIAGIALAEMIFDQLDPSLKVEWSVRDGNYIRKGMQFGKVYGCAHSIVVVERVALNFMQRMSGIATFTKVLIGGGKNHRMGLFDMVMIKDNHISIAGGVVNALKSVDSFLKKKNLKIPVEIETRTLEEVKDVLNYASKTVCSLTRIMLDNMVIPLPNGDVDVTMLKEAVEMIDGRFETEASGNVTLETVKKIGETGVTYISSGALTHSVKALDISLKIDTDLALRVARRTNRA
ncbi:nicotinate-nucleotide pyrophosphorylase [carboxylating], chloroplastic isoform X2 [Phalaenopsis equestris]|uniref:nicotinate-nucleotide pyrophosphorylase [carboxylating], chloroplastic isoform X2 n=1 Tax=Phalaenopsis equestris TaxID=78828 RepID=UPI0009E5E67A|nr:nicotinate-nucleotide pyrophosphorylase [carboxylating], chloroplastic isoform X2 [Phalaenopsis equestris]